MNKPVHKSPTGWVRFHDKRTNRVYSTREACLAQKPNQRRSKYKKVS